MRRILLVLMAVFYPLVTSAQTTTTRIAALSEDETISATLENPLTISLSDPETRTVFMTISLLEPASSVALNKWGGILYVGTEAGTVTAFSTTKLQRLWDSPRLSPHPIVAISRWDDQVLAIDKQSQPILLSARTGNPAGRKMSNGLLKTDITSPPESNQPIAAQLVEGQIRILQKEGAVYILPRGSDDWVRSDSNANASNDPIERGLKILNARPAPTYRTVTQSIVLQAASQMNNVIVDENGNRVIQTITLPARTATVTKRVRSNVGQSTESAGRFPWPPPLTDSFVSFDGAQLLEKDYDTFSAVDTLLKDALKTAEYSAPVYLSGPEDGFIMLTRLENIDASGAPKPDPGRFGIAARINEDFSLGDFIRIFLNGADPGYYRIIAFAVSKSVDLTKQPAPNEAEALGWLDLGESISLPYAIRSNPITDAHELTILVYEFEKQNKVDPARLTRGPRLSMNSHIAPMGLIEKLQ